MMNFLKMLRSGGWQTESRLRVYVAFLLATELAAAMFFAAGAHGMIVKLHTPVASDFVSFYAAGKLVNAGTPALAYDRAAHYAAEQHTIAPGIPYNYFYYPPVFLLVCGALASLPYTAAFVLFQLASFLPCLIVLRRILDNPPLWMLAAFPAAFWTLATGQNAFMTASLLAAATALLDSRPLSAGLLFGAVCYKPHLGLLVPVALAAGGYWRVVSAAAVTVVALVGTTLLIFGPGTWQAFLAAASGAKAVYSSASIDLAGLTSPFGLTLALGGSRSLAAVLQLIVTLATTIMVIWVWKGRQSLAVRAAVLLAAIPVAIPVVMFYDLMITGVALAWMVRAGREHGFPAWQRTGLGILFLLPLTSGNLGHSLQLLVPPMAAGLGFVLALRQAAGEPCEADVCRVAARA